jgi:wingless-type MMTV integration site family protein 6
VDGDWVWGGCGDNVNFGYRKSKDFMDAPYRRRSDIKTLVKLHNNNAGRLVSYSVKAKQFLISGLGTFKTLIFI